MISSCTISQKEKIALTDVQMSIRFIMNKEINRKTYKYGLSREGSKMLDTVQEGYEAEDVSYAL